MPRAVLAQLRRPRVFISYRREDVAHARTLYDRLVRVFGKRNVFIDLEGIVLGDRFWDLVRQKMRESDMVVGVVGPRWIATMNRLFEPADFVRKELELALEHKLRLLPVRVGGARMPEQKDLPGSIRDFSLIHAQTIRDECLHADAAELMKRLDPRVVARQARPLLLVLVVVVIAAWTRGCDLLRLDTLTTRVTMSFGDAIAPASPSDRVMLVLIDDGTLRQVRQTFDESWRQEHAKVLDRLSDAGAAAVAFDLYFVKTSPFDGMLRAAIDRAVGRGTRVVLGSLDGKVASGLADSKATIGLVCIGQDPSVVPLVFVSDGASEEPLPRYGLALLTAFPIDRVVLEPASPSRRHWDALNSHPELSLRRGEELVDRITASFKEMPTLAGAFAGGERQDCGMLRYGDERVNALIRLSRPEEWKQRTIAYEDVLFGPSPELAERLKGKIVLVGQRTPGEIIGAVRGLRVEELLGVEVHAAAVSNFVDALTVAPPQDFFTILTAFAAAWLGFTIRRRERTRAAGWVQLAVFVFGYGLVAAVVYAETPVVPNTSYPGAAILLAYWATGTLVPVIPGAHRD